MMLHLKPEFLKPNHGSFVTEKWIGIYKLIEEMGEVQQLLGKLGPFPTGSHPDNAGDLIKRLEDELGDLQAATDYLINNNPFDKVRIAKRWAEKYEQFEDWKLTGITVLEA